MRVYDSASVLPKQKAETVLSVAGERQQVETSPDLSRSYNWFNQSLILILRYSVSMKHIRNKRVQERSNSFSVQDLCTSLFLSVKPAM